VFNRFYGLAAAVKRLAVAAMKDTTDRSAQEIITAAANDKTVKLKMS